MQVFFEPAANRNLVGREKDGKALLSTESAAPLQLPCSKPQTAARDRQQS